MKKELVSAQISRDLILRGAPEWLIRYVRKVLSDEGYTNSKYENIGEGGTSTALENLNINKKITREEFDNIRNNTNDPIPKLIEYDLPYEFRNELSPAEKQEFWVEKKKKASELKAYAHNIDASIDQNMEFDGVKTQEEEDKKSTNKPTKDMWGDSEYYRYNYMLGDFFGSLEKYFHDFAKTIYQFKPDKPISKEATELEQSWAQKVGVPMVVTALAQAKDAMNILDHIQDEKNRDSYRGWIIKSIDKYWNYGNHGTGEVDYILTGEQIYRLKIRTDEEIKEAKNNGIKLNKYCVLKVPIKREFTREQVGDKTTVELTDETNQIQVRCPDERCGHLKFNVPVIPDQNRDIMAGEFFYKSGCSNLANDLSNSLEKYSETALFIEKVKPLDFINNELKKKHLEVTLTPKDIDVEETKPEKIKEVDLINEVKGVEVLNVWYGRAHRTQFKAEHFSDQA